MKRLIFILFFTVCLYRAESQIAWDSVCLINKYPTSFFYDTTDGKFYAAGKFNLINGKTRKGIAVYNGFSWDSLGLGINGRDTANSTVFNSLGTITRYGNKIATCGSFTSLGNRSAYCLGMWDGIKWDSLPGDPFRLKNETSGPVQSTQIVSQILVHGSDMYVAGRFDTVAGSASLQVAKWDGNTWYNLNFPVMLSQGGIAALAWYNGELYASGVFGNQINDTVNYILRYDGQNWKSVGGGIRGGGE